MTAPSAGAPRPPEARWSAFRSGVPGKSAAGTPQSSYVVDCALCAFQRVILWEGKSVHAGKIRLVRARSRYRSRFWRPPRVSMVIASPEIARGFHTRQEEERSGPGRCHKRMVHSMYDRRYRRIPERTFSSPDGKASHLPPARASYMRITRKLRYA